jgi:hypothetical protein
MVWWVWLCVAALLALAGAFFAMLSLSAGTAFGANYHSFSIRQRVMGKALYIGSMLAALVCAAGAVLGVFLAVKPLFA